jgi:transposase
MPSPKECGSKPISGVHQSSVEPAVDFDREAYRRRSIVECLIGWLKECRRIFSRFEKTAKNFGGMIKMAFIQRYLRLCSG